MYCCVQIRWWSGAGFGGVPGQVLPGGKIKGHLLKKKRLRLPLTLQAAVGRRSDGRADQAFAPMAMEGTWKRLGAAAGLFTSNRRRRRPAELAHRTDSAPTMTFKIERSLSTGVSAKRRKIGFYVHSCTPATSQSAV